MDAVTGTGQHATPAGDRAGVAIPDGRGAPVLGFTFVALVEYWLAPALFGITNYAGTWSYLGYVLFFALMASVGIYVLRPLAHRLATAGLTRSERWIFVGLSLGTFAAALLATRTIFPDSVAGNGPAVSVSTVYTPFGAWPSLDISVPTMGVAASLSVVALTILSLLAVLWAAAFVLELARRRAACPTPTRLRAPWRAPLASVGVWGPLGFVSSCASCSPLYLAVLGLAAPTAAASGYSVLPLVPWIGLTGLLELVSLALAIVLVRRSTGATARSVGLPVPGAFAA